MIRALSIFLLIIFLTKPSFAFSNRNLTVFAEQNMVPALIQISRLYSQKNYVIVSVNFNSSVELITDIDSGEPADVFISAHSGWIENLRQKGLTDVYNTGHIASDQLVLVTSKNNNKIPNQLLQPNLSLEKALKILNEEKAFLIIDPEGTSSGKYSKDFVKPLNLHDLQIFTKISEDRSLLPNMKGDNVNSYAILLASQIKDMRDLLIIAKQRDVNIFYQALVIAGDNMEIAREFLKFLKSEPAKSILRENNFIAE